MMFRSDIQVLPAECADLAPGHGRHPLGELVRLLDGHPGLHEDPLGELALRTGGQNVRESGLEGVERSVIQAEGELGAGPADYHPGAFQRRLRGSRVRLYQPAGPQEGAAEVADHHYHGIGESGTPQDAQYRPSGRPRGLPVVAEPLDGVRAPEHGGIAVVGRLRVHGGRTAQIRREGRLVRTRHGDADELGALDRRFGRVLPFQGAIIGKGHGDGKEKAPEGLHGFSAALRSSGPRRTPSGSPRKEQGSPRTPARLRRRRI